MSKYQDINSQAVADGFSSLSWQIQGLTERILSVNDTMTGLSDMYNRVAEIIE